MNKAVAFIANLWRTTRDTKKYTVLQLIVLRLLRVFSVFYFLGLYFKRLKIKIVVPPQPFGVKVIAVGNLSLGGTGKTGFVEFLLRRELLQYPAVLSRGYGGSYKKTTKACVVSDGSNLLVTPDQAGDEPCMMARKFGRPVAVSGDRNAALAALLARAKKKITTVILDDGYQTSTIAKDFTVLLIDARFPPCKDYLFPAGMLRERDYSRADAIVLTHARAFSQQQRQELIAKNFPAFDPRCIFAGDYNITGIFVNNEEDTRVPTPILAIAGIGSPEGFLSTLAEQGIVPQEFITFPDHHAYTPADIANILARAAALNCQAIVTTEKDWIKLQTLLPVQNKRKILWCVVQVRFEFLSHREYADFELLMKESLNRVV